MTEPARLPASASPHRAALGLERWSVLFVLSVACGITFPLLGSIGFFDPWETNYAEVAREMVVRGDYLYPYWKDAYFFSKPILLFWLTAPAYWLIGADTAGTEMSTLAELCGRLPAALFSVLCTLVVYASARRLWGRRPAVLSALVLATLPLWAFMSRQAITDMLYVAPASAALLLLALALFDDTLDLKEEPLPRWLVATIGVCLLPQLWEVGRSGAFLKRVVWVSSEGATRVVVSCALVIVGAGFLVYLWKRARDPLVHASALLFALSMLGKGPVGVVLCALALAVTVALRGEWHLLLRRAVPSATALFLAVCMPWTLVMLAFDGLDDGRKTWFQRFVMYDLLGRVGAGAHGDRGGVDYYVRYGAFAFFPWSVVMPPALFHALRASDRDVDAAGAPDPAALRAHRFTLLCTVWFLTVFVFFTATTTKFHHYIFPLAVPGALLVGRFLDALLAEPAAAPERRALPVRALAVFLVFVIALVARDLVLEPWQLIDLFTYHYKSYKPDYYFPSGREWRVGLSVAGFGAACIVGIGALLDSGVLGRAGAAAAWRERLQSSFVGQLAIADGRRNVGLVVGLLVAGVGFCIFAVQVHFNRASQHWSQRALVATYLHDRKADEPLVAYQMDWKGETFYAKNSELQVKKSAADLKAVADRKGPAYVLVQTDRFGGMKSALGKAYEGKIEVIDRSNVKWYLVRVDDAAAPVPGVGSAPAAAVPDVATP